MSTWRSRSLDDGSDNEPLQLDGDLRAVLARLDIPLTSIPLSTPLTWEALPNLIASHRRLHKKQGAAQGVAASPRSLGPHHHHHSGSHYNAATNSGRSGSSPQRRPHSSLEHRTAHHKQTTDHDTSHPQRKPHSTTTTHASPSSSSAPQQVSFSSAHSHHPTTSHSHSFSNPAMPTQQSSNPGITTTTTTSTTSNTVAYQHALHNTGELLMLDRTHHATIDSTLHDLKRTAQRVDGIALALSLGQTFRPPRRETDIEQNVSVFDPELRQIAELQRQVEVLRSDCATHTATIRRLHHEIEEKDVIIADLRDEVLLLEGEQQQQQQEEEDGDGGEEFGATAPRRISSVGFLHSGPSGRRQQTNPGPGEDAGGVFPFQDAQSIVVTDVEPLSYPAGGRTPSGSSSGGGGLLHEHPHGFLGGDGTPVDPPEFVFPCPLTLEDPIQLAKSPSMAARGGAGGGLRGPQTTPPPASRQPLLHASGRGSPVHGDAVLRPSVLAKSPSHTALTVKRIQAVAASRSPRGLDLLPQTVSMRGPSRAALERRGSSAHLLKRRLSMGALTAFRDRVLEQIAPTLQILGASVMQSIQRSALLEAQLVDAHHEIVAAKLHPALSTTSAGVSSSGAARRATKGGSEPEATKAEAMFERIMKASSQDLSSATPPPPESLLGRGAANDGSDEQTFQAAYELFRNAPLRLLRTPVYYPPRAQPFGPFIFLLAVAFPYGNILREQLTIDEFSFSQQQALFFIERTCQDYGGHTIVTTESHARLLAFDNPQDLCMCALAIQHDLPNTDQIEWPAGLENCFVSTAMRGEGLGGTTAQTNNQVPFYVFRGIRISMAMDVVESGPMTCLRDVADNGGVIYNGSDLQMCLWVAEHAAPGGSILIFNRMRSYVDDLAVELDDPVITFWMWRFLPGATAPTKLYEVYHRRHGARRNENEQLYRMAYTPLQLRVLTEEATPASLERLVLLHNELMRKQGQRVHTKEDESIIGLEGTVEQRLVYLRSLPAHRHAGNANSMNVSFGAGAQSVLMGQTMMAASTAAAVVQEPEPSLLDINIEPLFLSHVPALPVAVDPATAVSNAGAGAAIFGPPSSNELIPFSGDVGLLLLTIPAYDAMVAASDDATVSVVVKRLFRACREFAQSETPSLFFVRCSRDRMLLGSSDVMELIRYAMFVQQRLVTHAATFLKGVNHPVLLSMFAPRRFQGRVVQEGPAIGMAIHFSKVKVLVELYGQERPYYVGPEMDVLEQLAANLPDVCTSLLLSETAYAIFCARQNECTTSLPVIEPVGMIIRDLPGAHHSSSSSSYQSQDRKRAEKPKIEGLAATRSGSERQCVFALTPRWLVGRCMLFPAALWYSQSRRRERKDTNGGSRDFGSFRRRRRISVNISDLPYFAPSSVEEAQAWFTPIFLPRVYQRAARTILHALDASFLSGKPIRCVRPPVTALSESSTITGTRVQGFCAKAFFSESKCVADVSRLCGVVAQVARRSGRDEDQRWLEQCECACMESHDDLLLNIGKERSTTVLDVASLTSLMGTGHLQGGGGGGGAGGGGSAFQSARGGGASSQGDSSGQSTPKSHRTLARTASGRRVPALPGGHPTPFEGELPDQHHPHHHHQPAHHHAEGSPRAIAAAAAANHEVQALLDIDKERAYMIQRTKKTEAELFISHQLLSYYFAEMEQYLAPTHTAGAPDVPDEAFVTKCMMRLNALRDDARRQMDHRSSSDDESDDSDNDDPEAAKEQEEDEKDVMQPLPHEPPEKQALFLSALETIRVNERWREVLASVVHLDQTPSDPNGGGEQDYDPVLLCRSMIGMCCHHFLKLRLVARRVRRMQATTARLEQRTVDPTSRMGRKLAKEVDRTIDARQELHREATVAARQTLQLGELEEDAAGGEDGTVAINRGVAGGGGTRIPSSSSSPQRQEWDDEDRTIQPFISL